MRVRSFIALAAGSALALSLVPSVTVASAAEAPQVGDCVKDSARSAWDPLIPAEMVDCDDSHTGEVSYLGTYPEDLPKPSTIGLGVYEYEQQMCPSEEASKYVSGEQPTITTRLSSTFKVPTDKQWEAGDRTVLCLAVVFSAQGQQEWKGSLPEVLAGKGFTQFLACRAKKPKSGVWEPPQECTSNKQWLLVAETKVKGKATSNPYPGKAVQKAANKACKKKAKAYTKKGTKVRLVAAVPPESDWNAGFKFADCFIPRKNYNGKR